MKIVKLRISNYRGIESLETDVTPQGMVISGGNGKGKSSVLAGLQALLTARGVDASDIRIGAERAELLVDLDGTSVRRIITAKGNTLTVTNGDGFRAQKPQGFLSDLLGTGATIDPLSLFLAKPAERRKMILGALPVTVTLDQLRAWVPTIPATFDCSGHGLEVIERVRKQAYDQRTARNGDAKRAREEADRAAAEASKIVAPVGAATVADARATLDRAKAHATELESRRASVTAAIQRTEGARAKATQLRADADAVEVPTTDRAAYDAARVERDTLRDLVERLTEELEAAQGQLESARMRVGRLDSAFTAAASATKRVDDLRAQAAMIEETVGAATPTGPSDEDVQAATAAIDAATVALAAAETAERAAVAAARASETAAAAKAAEAEAARLDGIVKVLTNDAPAQLLAASNGIPGLSIHGDDITLDGKSLDALCGAEQMRFAVQIAKRMAGKVRVIMVDGAERLDPEQFDEFVREATSGDFQLLVTRVDRGEVHYEAITADDATAEAAE